MPWSRQHGSSHPLDFRETNDGIYQTVFALLNVHVSGHSDDKLLVRSWTLVGETSGKSVTLIDLTTSPIYPGEH